MRDNAHAFFRGYLKLLVAMAVMPGLFLVNAYAADQVGAIGYLTPGSDILDLLGTPGTRISEILVREGQEVKKGDILIKFSNHNVLKAEYDMALLRLEELDKTKAFKLDLQKYQIESAQLAYNRASLDLSNYKKLATQAISKKEMIRRSRLTEDAKILLAQEKVTFAQLKTQLEFNIKIAKSKIELASARYNDSVLQAPISGTILDVWKQIGEHIGGSAVIRMADLNEMYVRCEIYEGDLLKIKPGMEVKVSSNSLPIDITGKIERVGRVVNAGNRLAVVWALLDKSEIASKLIGMEVHVTIKF